MPFLSSKIWRDKTKSGEIGESWTFVQNNQISGRISGSQKAEYWISGNPAKVNIRPSPTLVYIHKGGTDSLKEAMYIPVWHLQIITYNDFLGNFLQPLWSRKDCKYSKKFDFSTPKDKEKRWCKRRKYNNNDLISAPVQHHPRTAWTWAFSMFRHGSEIFI